MTWQLEPLQKQHHREHFDCGETQLNDYLKHYARQDIKRNLSRTWVAVASHSKYESCARTPDIYQSFIFNLKERK